MLYRQPARCKQSTPVSAIAFAASTTYLVLCDISCDRLLSDHPFQHIEAAEQRRKWREQRAAAAAASESNGSGNGAVTDTR